MQAGVLRCHDSHSDPNPRGKHFPTSCCCRQQNFLEFLKAHPFTSTASHCQRERIRFPFHGINFLDNTSNIFPLTAPFPSYSSISSLWECARISVRPSVCLSVRLELTEHLRHQKTIMKMPMLRSLVPKPCNIPLLTESACFAF